MANNPSASGLEDRLKTITNKPKQGTESSRQTSASKGQDSNQTQNIDDIVQALRDLGEKHNVSFNIPDSRKPIV
jgi:hypothetical protein